MRCMFLFNYLKIEVFCILQPNVLTSHRQYKSFLSNQSGIETNAMCVGFFISLQHTQTLESTIRRYQLRKSSFGFLLVL